MFTIKGWRVHFTHPDNDSQVYFISSDEKTYSMGAKDKAKLFTYRHEAEDVANKNGGKTELVYEGHCSGDGCTEIVRNMYGTSVCKECGYGITSPRCTGCGPIANCSKCGTAIYTAELFRGPVCPNCNHWC